jgi:hypothetical protein
MFDMEVIVRRQNQEHCASITCMIRHYVARRAKVIEDHPHNAASSACARRGGLRQFRLRRLPSAVDVQPGTTDAPDPSAIVDKQHYVTLSDGEGLRRTRADPPFGAGGVGRGMIVGAAHNWESSD